LAWLLIDTPIEMPVDKPVMLLASENKKDPVDRLVSLALNGSKASHGLSLLDQTTLCKIIKVINVRRKEMLMLMMI
jgi:hypothetical protein